MPETTEKTKKAFIIRDFTEASTERQFKASTSETDTTDLTEGEFLNYSTAGLVRDPAPAGSAKQKTDA